MPEMFNDKGSGKVREKKYKDLYKMMIHQLQQHAKSRQKQSEQGNAGGSSYNDYSLGNYYSYEDEFDNNFDDSAEQTGLGFSSNHMYDSDKTFNSTDPTHTSTSKSHTAAHSTHEKNPQPPHPKRPTTVAGDVVTIRKESHLNVKKFSSPQVIPKHKSNMITAKFINVLTSNTGKSAPQSAFEPYRPGSAKNSNNASTSGITRPQSGSSLAQENHIHGPTSRRPLSGARSSVNSANIVDNSRSRPESSRSKTGRPFSGARGSVNSANILNNPQSRPESSRSKTGRPLSGARGSVNSGNILNNSQSQPESSRSKTGRPLSGARGSVNSGNVVNSSQPQPESSRPQSGSRKSMDYDYFENNSSRQGSSRPKSGKTKLTPTENTNAKNIIDEHVKSSRPSSNSSRPKSGKSRPTSIKGPNSSNPSIRQGSNAEAPVKRQSIERLQPLSNSNSAAGDVSPSAKSPQLLYGDDGGSLTNRSSISEVYDEGSDEELKRLAEQVDDGIYDPLASMNSLPRKPGETLYRNESKSKTQSNTGGSATNGSAIGVNKLSTEPAGVSKDQNDADEKRSPAGDPIAKKIDEDGEKTGDNKDEKGDKQDEKGDNQGETGENQVEKGNNQGETGDSQGETGENKDGKEGEEIKTVEGEQKNENTEDNKLEDGNEKTNEKPEDKSNERESEQKPSNENKPEGEQNDADFTARKSLWRNTINKLREKMAIDVGTEGIEEDNESVSTITEAQHVEECYRNKPKWHPPWQLKQEIVAHDGGIPELVFDPTNRWFATGSQDKTIKLWDIKTGRQKLVIKAHKREVRALAFGPSGHRKLYSTGDDRQLLCHDVEVNREAKVNPCYDSDNVISKFTGQSSVIYDMAFYHPENLLITCGRDKLLKVFDYRTQKVVRSMRGHSNTVSCVETDPFNKLVISGSHDATVRLWDVGDGRCMNTLFGHNKSVRALCVDPESKKFLSASNELIIAWDLPMADMIQEIPAEDLAINSITMNHSGVVVAGGSNGFMNLWDFESAFRFQRISRSRVYESHEIPICVFATKFDKSGKKLVCSDACNVVKIYSESFSSKSQGDEIKAKSTMSNFQSPSISTQLR